MKIYFYTTTDKSLTVEDDDSDNGDPKELARPFPRVHHCKDNRDKKENNFND